MVYPFFILAPLCHEISDISASLAPYAPNVIFGRISIYNPDIMLICVNLILTFLPLSYCIVNNKNLLPLTIYSEIE